MFRKWSESNGHWRPDTTCQPRTEATARRSTPTATNIAVRTRGSVRRVGGSRRSGDEVLRLGVGDDDRRGALLGDEVELLGERHADVLDVEELRHLGLVLEVGARRVAPRVARPAVLLTEEAGERRAVLVGEAPLLTDAAVPELGERLRHLDRQPVQEQVVLVLVRREQLLLALRGPRSEEHTSELQSLRH